MDLVSLVLWISTGIWTLLTLVLLKIYIDAVGKKREATSLAALILVCFALAFDSFIEAILLANGQASLPLSWAVPKAVLIVAAIEMFLVLKTEV